MQATLDATSIGRIAALLNANVPQVDRAVAALGLEPVLVLDYVRYFSSEQIEALREKIKQGKGEA